MINPLNVAKSITATKALSTLVNPNKILPVALIEVAATGGRTIQGYRRGGAEEARERFCEETTSAVFWLFGAKALNKLGDFIGEKMGIKHLDVDVGRDALRAPALNIPKEDLLKTSVFKFSKILGSAALATAFIGIVLPKLNHKITNLVRKANGLEPIPEKNEKKGKGKKISAPENKTASPEIKTRAAENKSNGIMPLGLNMPDINNFVQNSKERAKSLAFTGSGAILNALMSASHNLENNATWRLMSTDVGTVTGRVANSRNVYEGAEFFVRDISSIYFYMFATPVTQALLNKITGNTPIHPETLEVVKEHLKTSVGTLSYSPETFAANAKTVPDGINMILSRIPFKKDVVSLEDFNRVMGGTFKDKAKAMSEMQPNLDGKSVLSKMQVKDIVSWGWNTSPEFLKEAVNKGTYKAALDKKRFVSKKTTESIRESIDIFTDNLVKYAKKKNLQIDSNLIERFAKQTCRRNLGFRIIGMVFSGFGLAVLIPKLQYAMTEKLTGSKAFPGTAEYREEQTPRQMLNKLFKKDKD